jgi:hypothetical protein
MSRRGLTRRTFVGGTAAAFSLGYGLRAAHPSALRVGVTDWNLNLGADPGAGPSKRMPRCARRRRAAGTRS